MTHPRRVRMGPRLHLGRRRLCSLAFLGAASFLALALPASGKPETTSTIDRPETVAKEQVLTPPSSSPRIPAEAAAKPRPAETAVEARRAQSPGTPSRRSVWARIESIDPGDWLSRYGVVERRELSP